MLNLSQVTIGHQTYNLKSLIVNCLGNSYVVINKKNHFSLIFYQNSYEFSYKFKNLKFSSHEVPYIAIYEKEEESIPVNKVLKNDHLNCYL